MLKLYSQQRWWCSSIAMRRWPRLHASSCCRLWPVCMQWLIRPICAPKFLPQVRHVWSAVGVWGFISLSLRSSRFRLHSARRVCSASLNLLLMVERQELRFWACVSHVFWQISRFFRDVLRQSLNRFLWPPVRLFPVDSSPYRSCFGSLESDMRWMWPAHRVRFRCRIVKIDGIPVLSRISVFRYFILPFDV